MSKSLRRKHTNSKLGCLNCKRKKIRCDENLPSCTNCRKGKKDVCSYLSLDIKEVNRIKLTHSLRNEQNKLLNQDYRLPTSVTKIPPVKGDIEFKFELSNLPIRIPTMRYPPLQYKLLTIYDFDNEFEVIEGEDSESNTPIASSSTTSMHTSSTTPVIGDKLPNSIVYPTKFHKLVHKLRIHPKVKYNEYQFTKGTSLDYMMPFLHKRPAGVEIFEDLCICMGEIIILNEFKNNREDKSMIQGLKRKSFELHNQCLNNIKLKTMEFNHINQQPITNDNDSYMKLMTPILYYSNNLLSYCVLLLDFSMETYNKINSSSLTILKDFIKYNRSRPIDDKIIRSLISLNQYHILSINIPIYDPSYAYEILDNLKQLGLLYSKLNITNVWILKLYSQLVNFINYEIIPIIQSHDENNDKNVITYPITKTFSLLKNWLRLFPSQFFTPFSTENYIEDCLISNLSCYYYCVGAMLRSTFPYHLYFFGLNFTTRETDLPPQYFQPNIDNRINDYLRRHNYYGLRIYSFLRHRHRIFIKHINWKINNYPLEKFVSRRFDNIIEVPIKNFNTTLIRPEHYPSNTEPSTLNGHSFDRRDESYILKLYTRNVETLDFFNENYILQFDFESLRLLRDYRPIQGNCITRYGSLTMEEMDFYKDDRCVIMMKH